MKEKVFAEMELPEEGGTDVGNQYTKHLDDGIFELRASFGRDAARVLYFFAADERIIMTHGFVKKTRKAPRRELEKAKKHREDWRKRNE